MPAYLFLVVALSAAPPSYPAIPTCPPSGPSPYVDVTDVNGAYGDRSIAIVNAALNGDMPALTRLVGAGTHFTLWRGDSGSGPGGVGPVGAVRFFQWFAPTSHQFLTDFAGPIAQQVCDGPITVDLLLEGRERAANLHFRYERGVLVDLTGREVFVSRGQLPRPRD